MENEKYEIRRYRRWRTVFNQILEGVPQADRTFDPEDMALKLAASDVQDLRDMNEKVKDYLKVHAGESLKTQLITIMIDQKVDEATAIHTQIEVIDKLKEANYKFMSDVSHRFEYFTKEGFNPHIHILTIKNNSDGKVAQQFRRKLMEGKNKISEVYRIHVSTLNYEMHRKYINGEKTELKEEFLKADAEFREKHNINDIYYW